MSIKEDILQIKSFRNQFHQLLVNIQFTNNWVVEQIKPFITSQGITLQQYNILRILRGSQPTALTTSEIQIRMLDKMSDTSRLVERLITKELAKKDINPKDKRRVAVTITQKGLDLLKKIDESAPKQDLIFKNLTEEEATRLNQLLDKVRSG